MAAASTDILLRGCNVKEPRWKGSRSGDSFQHPDLKAEEKLITADIDMHAGWLAVGLYYGYRVRLKPMIFYGREMGVEIYHIYRCCSLGCF